MNLRATQFAVALAAILILGAVTIISVWAASFNGGDKDLAFAGIAGLSGAVGQSVAFLFRLNGTTGGT